MISYSQNFEDVILQRVFSEVAIGCFVDVGACSPVRDSNTVAFYQKGWRGICIDPLSLRSSWEEARPDDVFLNAAVGSASGETTFHIFQHHTQISTTSSDTIEHWQRHGLAPDQSITVPVLTLDSVLEQHLGDRTLHFIAIDVEGMEKDVLAGLDLKRFRPWVLVVEATVPGTSWPAHEQWEPSILDAGYQMVYFDGLNRFYLAQERSQLLDQFALPPNVWDEFTKAKELENERKIEALEATVAELTRELSAFR